MKVGILALQGAVGLHRDVLERLGAGVLEVRTARALDDVDALVLPGGESTTVSRLLMTSGLFEPLAERLAGGLPVFGTCAGLILLAAEVVDGRPDQRSFGAIDLTARRNAFGRQVDSFEADLAVEGIDGGAVHGVFIRAPIVERVGPAVEVLATVDDRPVACRQGAVLVTAFHPELATSRDGTPDRRLHERFLELAGA